MKKRPVTRFRRGGEVARYSLASMSALLLALGCQTGATPGASTVPTQAGAPASPKLATSASNDADRMSAQSAAPSQPPALGRNALQELAQTVLDLPQLQPYFHEREIPSRSPLVILDNQTLDPSVSLVKFGKPVLFKSHSALAPAEAVFEFESIRVDANSAQVQFRYRVEGLRGHATLRRGESDHWTVESVKLVES